MILFLGAHYTYAEVDTFKFIRELFGWQRNNYDKVGHFAQGFVPAIIAREVLIRRSAVNGRGWRNLFVLAIGLAFSALYEIFEWIVAVVTGDSAEGFLGTQGYVWDTQSTWHGAAGRNFGSDSLEQTPRSAIGLARRQLAARNLVLPKRLERVERLERLGRL